MEGSDEPIPPSLLTPIEATRSPSAATDVHQRPKGHAQRDVAERSASYPYIRSFGAGASDLDSFVFSCGGRLFSQQSSISNRLSRQSFKIFLCHAILFSVPIDDLLVRR